MSDVKRCPCRGSNEMCGCQNGPHPVRQDPEAEITALRARLADVEALSAADFDLLDSTWKQRAERAEDALATARRDALEEAAAFVEGNVYTSNGGEVSMQPATAKFHGMDRHHATIAAAIRALIAQEQEPTDVSIVSGDKPRT